MLPIVSLADITDDSAKRIGTLLGLDVQSGVLLRPLLSYGIIMTSIRFIDVCNLRHEGFIFVGIIQERKDR